ncbi:hypothetical protein [Caldisalinibacter kiritimatiensis]|uniref:Uncharacterized protein n=1 Tax=Caldisalinibacter kiritimatiensis TaxID=1304284 RepID=R1CN22_9FIRM|nr:hypothetical protein [Caldisalinibacter kiritimatiensis]EOD00101.1 hypothetical protein L21TH_1867 [Caldisalinibacter kiritimatiensis]
MENKIKTIYLIALDVVLVNITFIVAFLLRFQGVFPFKNSSIWLYRWGW